MSLTAAEVTVCNQSLDKLGAAVFTYALQTTNEALKCIRHYSQTRDALLRSFEWYWAKARVDLVLINTLALDSTPSGAWAVGDTLTGASSGVTCTILEVTSTTVYVVAYLSGTFTDGEIISNGTYSRDCGAGYPVVAEDTPDNTYWEHQYQLPTDFLRLVQSRHYHRYTIEGKRLLTDESTFHIHYIKKITDPADFDPLFTEVLILQLALKLVNPLAGVGTQALKQDLKQELATAMSRARAVCGAETNTTGRSDWLLARYGSGKVSPLDPTHIY
jgi:hypothetical protein